MYRIGEFSYLCQATLKTLRHYDKIDLLKPAEVDYITGYRYYTDEQVLVYQKIKALQKTGFTLKEIKDILENPSDDILKMKKDFIEKESLEKVKILNDLKSKGESHMKVQFIRSKEIYVLGVLKDIKSKEQFDLVLEEVDKLVKVPSFKNYQKVFFNYEKGYKENDISCFIGRIIPNNEKATFELIANKNKKLVLFDNKMIKNVLHIEVQNNIIDSYNEIIKYASKNNIQIRGEFQEVYSKVYNNDDNSISEKIDIYVEAYDLNLENEAAIKHNESLKKRLKNIFPKDFLGKWKLEGEVIELPKAFNPKKKHYMPDTILKEVILNSDGTTNFKHISWKENYLIIKDKDITIYNPMYIEKKDLKNI